jgi:hypothetical protein
MKLLLVMAFALLLPVAALAEAGSNFGANCNAWLQLVDQAKYDASWDTASDYFKLQLAKEKWGELIKAARDTVGQPLSRKSESITPTDRLPNMPFGKYLVIVLRTKFTMNESVSETIIMKLEHDEWKVAGYFIK